jgi:hypothetical protein
MLTNATSFGQTRKESAVSEELEGFSQSPLREATVQLHEMYIELRSAGFSKKDSLHLVSKILTTSLFKEIDE